VSRLPLGEIAAGARVPGEGLYRLPEAAYHADPAPEPSLSSSLARVLLDQSPLHAWTAHPRLNFAWEPEAPSARMTLGSACHALLLGHGAAVRVVDADSWRTKAAQMERDAAIAAGELPLLAAAHEEAQNIVEAARDQMAVCGLEAAAAGFGDREVSAFARHESGVWLRARFDWIAEGRGLIVDYKTTENAAAKPFARRAAQMGYDVQAAFYLHVLGLLDSELAGRVRFVFVAQEIRAPYALAAYELSEADLEVARRKVEAAASLWSRCLSQDSWPAYPPRIERITLPHWSQARWLDRELEGTESDPAWQLAAGGERA